MAQRKRIGRPASVADGQIAAIARTKQFAVATREADGFKGMGVALIDPGDP